MYFFGHSNNNFVKTKITLLPDRTRSRIKIFIRNMDHSTIHIQRPKGLDLEFRSVLIRPFKRQQKNYVIDDYPVDVILKKSAIDLKIGETRCFIVDSNHQGEKSGDYIFYVKYVDESGDKYSHEANINQFVGTSSEFKFSGRIVDGKLQRLKFIAGK